MDTETMIRRYKATAEAHRKIANAYAEAGNLKDSATARRAADACDEMVLDLECDAAQEQSRA